MRLAKKPPKPAPGALAVAVLAAGRGERLKSDLPKVLHRLAGRAMVAHVLAAAAALKPAQTIVVIGRGMEAVAQAVKPARAVVQHPPRGTGDAVAVALRGLKTFRGDVLVLYGDAPLVTPEILLAMRAAKRGPEKPALVVLGFRTRHPGKYGRLVLAANGQLERIVEQADASPAERKIELCNAGAMLADGPLLGRLLASIKNRNRSREFYLTDAVAAARSEGHAVGVVVAEDAAVALGVNTRAELAVAEAIMQSRLRERAMANGVSLIDPNSVWLSFDTQLARDVVVEPNVVFGANVRVGPRARIRAFSHLEGARIGAGASIGPFARLRPGADIAAEAHIGNFVEIKNARIARGAKANHLAYIGDAAVGANANIGAGTITCNYDGFKKYKTEIGAGAFIGSNSALVAPVKIGRGAVVGAGSVIVRDVAAGALAVARGKQIERAGWAARRLAKAGLAKSRRKKSAAKKAKS